MGYALGVDLGTTYTAAAVGRDGEVTMATLGVASPEMPTVVAIDADGHVVGEAAERRAVTEPQRVAREFKRRVGDPIPIVVDGASWSAESLMAVVLNDVIERVSEREGGPPDDLVVTVPASWGQYKLDKLTEAVAGAGWPGVRRLTEPEAAARWYLRQDKLEPGAVVAVFDFGGGTFDSAILRHHDGDRFERLGEAMGIERLGGVDLDEAVFQRVLTDAGIDLAELIDDPPNRSALARLRADCTEAKEALSADTSTTIAVMIPGHHSELRLTRQEFESMIRPAIGDAIGAMDATIASAGLEPRELDAVLLVGGSSRIPLVAQMVSAHFDCPTLVDAHPKHTIASGATISIPETGQAVAVDQVSEPAAPPPLVDSVSEQTVETVVESPGGPSSSRVLAIVMAVVALIAIGSAVAFLTRGGDEDVSATGDDAQMPAESSDGGSEGSSASPLADQPVTDFAALIGTNVRSEAPAGIATHELGFVGEGPPGDPTLLWTLEPQRLWSVVVGGSDLVFALEERASESTLVAYDGASGTEAWATPSPWGYEIFTAGSIVMVSSQDGVQAFDQRTGERLGFVGPAVDASPGTALIRGPVALLSSSTDTADRATIQVRSVDLATNEVNWMFEEEFVESFGLVSFLADEATAIAGEENEVVALDVESGDVLWRSDELGGYDIQLLAAGVLVANLDGNMTGLDARTGAELWTTAEYAYQLASDGDALFTMNRFDELEAISLATGMTEWVTNPTSLVDDETSIVIGNETIYVLQGDGVVTAHEVGTGELVWSGTLDGLPANGPEPMTVAVADERLLVVRDSTIHVFGQGTGPPNTDAPEPAAAAAFTVEPGAPTVSAHPRFNTGGRPFVEAGPVGEPSVLWQVSRVRDTSPAIAAGGFVLYVDSLDGDILSGAQVVAADALTGVEQWTAQITGPIYQLHAVGSTIIARTGDGLVGIDLTTGDVLGVIPSGSPPVGSVLEIVDGSLIVGWSDARSRTLLESIDVATGETNWSFVDDTSGTTARQIMISDDTVMLVLDDSTVAIDLVSGQELWRTLDFGGGDVVLLTGDTLLVQLDFPDVAAIDARSGETRWVSGSEGAGARDDGSSFYVVQIRSRGLAKVDLDDGGQLWVVPTDIESGGVPLISGDVVYGFDVDGNLVAHRTSDGGKLWSLESVIESRSGMWGAVGSNVIVLTDAARIVVVG